MFVGYRTLKTALGAALSIFIAQALQLEFYTSAGIITILCIKATKRESIKTSFTRFLACLIGLLVGGTLFTLFGYTPVVVALILAIFIPMLVKIKFQEGFITSAVVLLHLYIYKEITVDFLTNEIQVIGIGIGIALLMNLYMPNVEKRILTYRTSIERNFSFILKEMVYYLRYGESNWDGQEMLETAALLHEAKSLAFKNVENHLLRNQDTYYHYFEMREKQFELLEIMLGLVSSLPHHVTQGDQIAVFLEKLSNHIHPQNTANLFLEQLNELRNEFKDQLLPQSREEFESRAVLFQLINEIERYLFIKQNFRTVGTKT
jgi:uncharacterized membrane protein YgaE (UPF0421/DUF939 family)